MLIVLVAGLFLGCVAVLIVKKNRESLLLAATCFSLMLFLMGIMIVIAKRGGVSAEVERFLYFSRDLRIWLQYRLDVYKRQVGAQGGAVGLPAPKAQEDRRGGGRPHRHGSRPAAIPPGPRRHPL